MTSRICARQDCANGLDGKRANAIYCSRSCKERASVRDATKLLPLPCYACQVEPRTHGSYCAGCNSANGIAYTQRRRSEAMALLGTECARCGIDDVRILCIDHINGGGSKERKGLAPSAYYKLIASSPERYQLLCWNCNHLKRLEEKEFGEYAIHATGGSS